MEPNKQKRRRRGPYKRFFNDSLGKESLVTVVSPSQQSVEGNLHETHTINMGDCSAYFLESNKDVSSQVTKSPVNLLFIYLKRNQFHLILTINFYLLLKIYIYVFPEIFT